MEKIHGETQMQSANGNIESHMELNAGPASRNDDEAGGRLSDLGERANSFAGDLRHSLHDGLRTATEKLDRTGVVGAIRNNPLTAVGVAFVGGVAIAVAAQPTERHWMFERARHQLRTAIISGLSAVAVQEVRSLLGGKNGLGDLVEAFLERTDDALDL
jgi:hypothetical protein